MANLRVVTYNPTSGRLEVPQAGDVHLIEKNIQLNASLLLTGTVDGRDIAADGTKLDLATMTGAMNLDTMDAKVGFLTITQAVDLDAMETRVNALDAAVVLMGVWDASTAVFPTSTVAGESWICSVAGTVGGIPFALNDRIVALIDGASTSVYAGNWHKLDYSDEVSTVAGRTGAVVLVEADITDLQSYLLATSIDSLSKLNTIVGETLIITGDARLSDTRAPKWPINTGLTAYATGGQANATLLNGSELNVCTTCATAADSFKLPTAVAELVCAFTNRGAAYAHLYPNTSDEIETEGVNNPIVVNPYGTVELAAIDATNWILI